MFFASYSGCISSDTETLSPQVHIYPQIPWRGRDASKGRGRRGDYCVMR